jgi:hypothetical protein
MGPVSVTQATCIVGDELADGAGQGDLNLQG